jgi:hypothetical protein
MYVSIVDFTVGQGDADTLLQRIEGDLVPVYRDAKGSSLTTQLNKVIIA